MAATPTVSSETREWIQTILAIGTAIVGVVVALGLTESVQALLRPKTLVIASDVTWNASDKWSADWQSSGFAASTWPQARVLDRSRYLGKDLEAPMIWAQKIGRASCRERV